MVKFDTLNTYIDKHAQNLADKTFIIDADNELEISYSNLHKDIWRMKHYFDDANLKHGDHIGFMLDNSYYSVLVFLAAIYHGLTVVPINILSGDKVIEYVLQHSGVKVVFTSKKYQQQFASILNTIQKVYTYNSLDTDITIPPAIEYNHHTKDTHAVLIYTSGTTGMPKGVVLTHKNIISGGDNTVVAHSITPKDRALCVLPLFHINAEIVTIIAPLISASSVVITEKFSTSKFWNIIEKYHCTWFSVVPTIISYLLNDKSDTFATSNTTSVRFGRSASAPLPQEIHKNFEKIFAITLIETMGLSETAAQILSNPLEKQKCGSAGIAYGNTVKVFDDYNVEVNDSVIGQLVIKGDNVMSHYHNNEEATKETFTDTGYLLTGDLGYKDNEGFFFITGRKKELIIKGGENISPREIDEVLYQHHEILEACAFAIPDEYYGENIAICVYLKENSTLSQTQIKEFCQQFLGKFKTPEHVFISQDFLLKGPSGKIQRLKIAQAIVGELDKKN